MKHLFYTSSQSAWKGFKTTLTSAQKSIYIEMYIFIDDTAEGKELLGILADKANAGIRVMVILDAFGSKELSSDAITTLQSAGVEILFFKKLFRRLHRKIMVIDETVGFVGGVNIHKGARLWDDLLVRVEGKVVHSLIRSFAKVYKACGGKDGYLAHYRKKALWGGTRIWFLEHLPSIQRPRLRDYYTEAIVQATKEVVIITPYFLPSRWLKKLLRETQKRGVSIKIFVPEKTDLSLITKANYTYMRLLGQEGIVFYTLPTMNHAKLLLVDDSLALVGSQNIDALSFDFNAEAGLYFDDPAMIKDLRGIVEKWRASATVFDPHGPIRLLERFYSYIVRLVQPLL
ncbi:MAG: phosphatidylserine/phosphatidylglycerophosphate/cardiolipin synthase family protein [Candidatus Pacebacteria bacterium]|nr:phosphatidylserine/phosphatidylglycerophosphate/cardiolipin synthase family protein [Candidatus Paceibacterota bacterium]